MLRQIIRIDEEKCNGCGLCATACHEGAIDMVNGKAKLIRENFCDGFGDCLPNCPTGAITFETKEAPAYDEAAVLANKAQKEEQRRKETMFGNIDMQNSGCPGTKFKILGDTSCNDQIENDNAKTAGSHRSVSRLKQWPVQIKLLPTRADFYDGCKLLIAADCTAYAYANMHEDFMKGKVTMIGCPKLDDGDYTDKLTEIIRDNDIKGVTVVRMEVPCCGGLQRAAENALKASGKFIPWQVITISNSGEILDI